jgi:2-keto-4-pentenoate hydratase
MDETTAMADPAGGMRALLASRSREIESGAAPIGWKIGINVAEVQARLGLDAPVVGYLTSSSLIEDGGRVGVAGWANPMLEPEIAIRVGEDGRAAGLAPAIELVDIDIPLDDLHAILARNVFHRGVVIGAEVEPPAPAAVRCKVLRDGEQIAGAEPPFDADRTVAHVRDFLARHGSELRSGDWIIAGSLTAPVALDPGRYEVAIGEVGRVSVGVDA